MRAQDTLDANETIIEAYPGEAKVIRVDREDDRPLFRFEAPLLTPKESDTTLEWENEEEALLYAAVYAAVDGFREEKTGRRGIPPKVQRAGQMAVISYLSTQDGITTKWISRFYDLEPQRIYEYRSRIRSRAEVEKNE